MTTPAEQARALTLEERAQRIIRTLRPTDSGSWAANQVYVMAELTAAHEAGRESGLEAAAHEFTLNWVKIMQQTQSYDFVTALRQQAKEAG